MGEESLGKQIERLRKKLGFSQEALAEEAGLNLRTIQRIENGETIPRADTLKRVVEALKVTPDEIIDYSLIEDKYYLSLLNLSSLGFLFFPLLGILLPLIFWVMKRDKIKDVDLIGKKILNFQITWGIIFFGYYAALITALVLKISIPIRFGHQMSPILVTLVYYLLNFTYIGINEVLILKNKSIFYKPAFRFLK